MSVTSLGEFAAEIDATLHRKEEGIDLAQESYALSHSLYDFVLAAWSVIVPRPLVPTWHIRTLCEHVQAAYEREIPRLVVTIQPGSLKSTLLSVMGPAWWWTRTAEERFVTASWRDRLAERDARYSRALIRSRWYQARWGDVFSLSSDENLKTRYSNDRGGHRVATHVGGGTGDRGGILQLDDPHNAQDARSETHSRLEAASEWWSDTWVSRMDDLVNDPGAMIVIGQRIHEADLIGHVLATSDAWTHLCLPTEYEKKHPLIPGGYPAKAKLPSGRKIQGDVRTREGELIAPKVQTKAMLSEKVSKDGITAHVYAGQYQQRPAPREGKLLKRADWRYYDPELSFYRRASPFGAKEVIELNSRVGAFDYLVHSWDTSVKDTAHSDFAAGGVWACSGAMRFLLRIYHERAALNATIEGMLDLATWALALWPEIAHYIVIERSANGPDAAKEIRKRVQGVVEASAVGSKWVRASAAEPALVGHNCLLPGYTNEDGETYDSRTPMDVQEFVEELAAFDQGAHDDQVDQWSSMVNWTRGRDAGATVSVPSGQVRPPKFHEQPTDNGAPALRVRPRIRS